MEATVRFRVPVARSSGTARALCIISLVVQAGLAAPVRAAESQVVGATEDAIVIPTSIYWGATVAGWPDKTQALDAFETTVRKRMSIVHWGEPWLADGKPQGFQKAYFDRTRLRGSIPLLDWGSWDTCCDQDQPEFQLSAIVNGAFDGYLIQWASDAALWGHPFFLRFDPEMNGWWYPWNEQANSNKKGDFVRAWQHVHDIFVQQGATNATWVWCPNIVGVYSTPMPGLYPGDDYVDWTCIDGYNWGTDYDNAWQTFTQVFTGTPSYGGRNSYQELLALAPSKPIMIGETASSEHGGSKADWIRDMLGEQLPGNFPQIKAIVWFDGDGGDSTLTWPIDSSEEALGAFGEMIGSQTYAGNAYATLDVSPIPPPEFLVPPTSIIGN
jgi:hypothetical protein